MVIWLFLSVENKQQNKYLMERYKMARLPNLNTQPMNPGMFKCSTQAKFSFTGVEVLIHFDTNLGCVQSGLLEIIYFQIFIINTDV